MMPPILSSTTSRFRSLKKLAVLIGESCVDADVDELADLFVDRHFLELLVGPIPGLFRRLESRCARPSAVRRVRERGQQLANDARYNEQRLIQNFIIRDSVIPKLTIHEIVSVVKTADQCVPGPRDLRSGNIPLTQVRCKASAQYWPPFRSGREFRVPVS